MEFKVIWTIVDMIVAAMCLYQAGKYGAVIELDRGEDRKTPTFFQVFYWLNMFFGLYMLIVIYGKGIERGGL